MLFFIQLNTLYGSIVPGSNHSTILLQCDKKCFDPGCKNAQLELCIMHFYFFGVRFARCFFFSKMLLCHCCYFFIVFISFSQSSSILRLNQELMSSRASLRTAGNSRKSWEENDKWDHKSIIQSPFHSYIMMSWLSVLCVWFLSFWIVRLLVGTWWAAPG